VSDYYHDDPVEFSEPKSKKLPALLAFILFVIAGGNFLQTTLAANIAINTGGGVEFGQGRAVTAGCAGSTNLTLTPKSSFVNSAGGGAHYLSSVTVTGIPASCNGKDFQISAFDNTAGTSALPIFSGTKTTATIYNNAGTFQQGFQGTGSTVSSTSGGFTITFTTPAALAANVVKLTLQSTEHVDWSCVAGGPCTVGETGPGGGIIFYVSAGFSCGPTASNTCTSLEIAPNGWNGTDSESAPWASAAYSYTTMKGYGGMVEDWQDVSLAAIGRGYVNTLAINARDPDATIATRRAQTYRGGNLSDWYLPNVAEANAICKWTTGQNPLNPGTACAGGTKNQSRYGAQSGGLLGGGYWTSSERMYLYGQFYDFGAAWAYSDNADRDDKTKSYRIRPIRAF
jgi:hypothetical protein